MHCLSLGSPHILTQTLYDKLWIYRVISSESLHLSLSAIYVYASPFPKRSQFAQGTVGVGLLSVFKSYLRRFIALDSEPPSSCL
jgi:hypothetical protein